MGIGILIDLVDVALKVYNTFKDKSESSPFDLSVVIELLGQILDAVEDAKNKIIEQVLGTRLADLDGSIRGLIVNFRMFRIFDKETEHDKWESESERLREIVDGSAGVVGDVEAELDRLDFAAEIEYVLRVFALLLTILPLRAAAMITRTLVYGINDMIWIPEMLDEAKLRAERLRATLHALNDQRFSPDYVTERGEPMGGGKYSTRVGYKFEGDFIQVAEVPPGKSIANAVARARTARANRKKKEYQKYPGVEALRAFDKLYSGG